MKNFKVLFVVPKDNHQLDASKALSEGFKRHGLHDIRIVKGYDPRIHNADLVAIWAWRPKRKGSLWWLIDQSQKAKGNHTLVMERAYVGERHLWTSLGYDGLNGRADFCNKDITDISRFNKHFPDLMKTWQNTQGSNKVLIAGQCKMDAAVSHININEWYRAVTIELAQRGYDVHFRPHPLNTHPWIPEPDLPVTIDLFPTMEESMVGTKAVITFNSNAGVLSTLAGIPTVSMDVGSMVYGITSHKLSDISQTPERSKWAAQIAYTQWLPEEMESGEAWEHLKKKTST